jgi:hypothetical protein
MDLSLREIERTRFTIIEAFGAIGGIFTIFSYILATLVHMVTYNSVDNFLVSFMFRKLNKKSDEFKKYQGSEKLRTRDYWKMS